MSEYRIERVSPENLPDLLILFEDSFGAKLNLDFVKQKYDTRAFGASYIGYLAYSESNEPAAYYGVFPILVRIGGREVLAAQSGDTMTHSNHRRKGLFVKLADATFALAKENGVQFIFGFPNSNSYPGFMKLGWTHDHDLNLYRLRVATLPLSKMAKKFRWLSQLYKVYTRLFIGAPNQQNCSVPNSCLTDPTAAGLIHDERFFAYKTYLPKYLLKTAGGGIYFKIDGRLMAGDFEAGDEAAFRKALSELRRKAWWCGANEIDFQASPGSPLDSFLLKIAKPKKGIAACYFDLGSGLDLASLRYTMSDLDTF